MLKIIASTYKELYAWSIHTTKNNLLSFILSYVVLVILQVLNMYSIIMFIQKILGITLFLFIFSEKIFPILIVLAIMVFNFFFLGTIWSEKEETRVVNHHGFAYIAVSVVLGAIAYLLGR